MSTLNSESIAVRNLFIVIAAFFVLLVPILPELSVFHGDERFYTDAAIRMVQTGDYLTPYYQDGSTRFRKPVLTYWVLSASYKLLGVSYLSSRLPFLIAACAIIWMTWKLSVAFFHRRDTALLSAIIIGSNIQTLTIAVRSTPDILQALFLSVSLYGFARIIFSRERSIRAYGCAYLGAALTVLTKGTLGMFPVVYSFLFCLARRDNGVRVRELIDVKVMLVAAAVAFSWFAAMYFDYGDAAIKGFYGDQLGERLSGSKWYVLDNAVEYLWAVIRHFTPWTLMIAGALVYDRKLIGAFFKDNKEKCIYITGWFLVLFVVFCGGNIQRSRYLYPSYPLLSCLFAAILLKIAAEGQISRLLKKAPGIIVPAGLVLGLVLLALSGLLRDQRILAGAVLFVLVVFLLTVGFVKRDLLSSFMGLGIFWIVVYSAFKLLISPVFACSPAPLLAERLSGLDQKELKVAAVGIHPKVVGKVKVLLGGNLDVKLLPEQTVAKDLGSYSAVILSKVPDSYKAMLAERGYTLLECGHDSRDLKPSEIWAAVTDREKLLAFFCTGEPYYLAVRNDE